MEIGYDTKILAFKMHIGKWPREYGRDKGHEKFNLDKNGDHYYGMILYCGDSYAPIPLEKISDAPNAKKEEHLDDVLLAYFEDFGPDKGSIKLTAIGIDTTVYREAREFVDGKRLPDRMVENPYSGNIDYVWHHTVTPANQMYFFENHPIIIKDRKSVV